MSYDPTRLPRTSSVRAAICVRVDNASDALRAAVDAELGKLYARCIVRDREEEATRAERTSPATASFTSSTLVSNAIAESSAPIYRIENRLVAVCVFTLGDLAKKRRADIAKLRGIGSMSMRALDEALAKAGLDWAR